MKKKAFFFLLDGIFAIFILSIGYMVLSSDKSYSSSDIPISASAEDGMQILSTAKINELCTNCSCSNKVLSAYCEAGFIGNRDQAIVDYLGELYYHGKKSEARALFENMTLDKGIFRQDVFGVEFRINKEVIYSRGKNFDTATDLIATKKIVMGYFENASTGNVTYFGPYPAGVSVWKK